MKLSLISSIALVSFFLGSNYITFASPVVDISEKKAEGREGVYKINLYPNHGVNISLTHIDGLKIENAWLDDTKSRIEMRADGRLCNPTGENPCDLGVKGGKVLHLKLIKTEAFIFCAPRQQEFNRDLEITPIPPSGGISTRLPEPPNNLDYLRNNQDCSDSNMSSSDDRSVTLTVLASDVRVENPSTKIYIFDLQIQPEHSRPDDLRVLYIDPNDSDSSSNPTIKYHPLEEDENKLLNSNLR